MLDFIEIIKVIFLGIVEGITEWLPISSTGHMLLVDEFIKMNVSADFKEMFFVVIQLGAILAVVVLFWNKMFPFQFKDKSKPVIEKNIFSMWFKVVVACIPGAVVTILFDDFIEAHLHTPIVIAITLIVFIIPVILVALIGGSPTQLIIAAQALNGVALPLVFILCWVLCNQKEFMGEYKNNLRQNIIFGIVTLLTLMFSLNTIINSVLPKIFG